MFGVNILEVAETAMGLEVARIETVPTATNPNVRKSGANQIAAALTSDVTPRTASGVALNYAAASSTAFGGKLSATSST